MEISRDALFWLCVVLLCHVESEGQLLHRQRRQITCYARVGCFNNDPPYNNTAEVAQDPAFIGTVFRLYTRRNPTTPHFLITDNSESVLRSNFDRELPVKILVHGFLQTSSQTWILATKRELLRKEPVNVITVDWGQGAGFPYTQAAANTRVVGAVIAHFVAFLNHQTGTNSSQYHLIGQSLGAHVAGYAGNRLPGFARITGLDPAQPNFDGESPLVRLDSTDATFVDVIHTDGSPYNTVGGFGMLTAVGHVDFYPNGGQHQPGCPNDNIMNLMSEAYSHGVDHAEDDLSCDHDRSVDLFIESINSLCPFTAYPCTSAEDFYNGRCFHCGNRPCPLMGYRAAEYKARGTFYLATNAHSPFCAFQYFVQLHLSETMTNVRGVVRVRLQGSRGQTRYIEIHSGRIRSGSILRGVVASRSDLGSIQSVRVIYQRESGFFSWGSGPKLKVTRLMAFSARRRQSIVFCPGMTLIVSGTAADFIHRSDNPNVC